MDVSKIKKADLPALQAILNAAGGLPFFARDKNGEIYAYEEKPLKSTYADEWFKSEKSKFVKMHKDILPDVKWLDTEPINISKIVWFLQNAITRHQYTVNQLSDIRKMAEQNLALPGRFNNGYYTLPNSKGPTKDKELAIKAEIAYLEELVVPDEEDKHVKADDAKPAQETKPALPAAGGWTGDASEFLD